MRYYKNKQAEMLNRVSLLLQREQAKIIKKVPALRDFISKFDEMEKVIYGFVIRNPTQLMRATVNKQIVRNACIKILIKMIAVLKASGYANKGKSLNEMTFTPYDLKKAGVDKLGSAYRNVYAGVKKVRNLSQYGLTSDDMKDAQAYYDEFAAVKNAPAQKKKELAKRNKITDEAVKQAIIFLQNHIDPLMIIAVENDMELQLSYKAARQVLPRGQGRPTDAEAAYRKSRGGKKLIIDN